MTTLVLVVLVCVLLEGFFSGSEIAVVSADRARLSDRAAQGDSGAALALRLLADPKTLLSTTLVGTNLSVVTATVVATLYFLDAFRGQGELYSLAVMSPTLLLFGEVVPKSFFQQHADYLATRVVYPLVVFRWIFAPILLVVRTFAGVVTRALRVERDETFVTREDLQQLIDHAARERGGEITKGEAEMISNVLAVEDRIVEQVMIPLSEVCSIDVEDTVIGLIDLVRERRHTRIPVYEDRIDNIVGVVHAFTLVDLDPSQVSIRDLMQPAVFVPETQPVLDLVKQLQKIGRDMAVVVNEYGGAEGVVTMEDALEEIVGEIEDEYDTNLFVVRQDGPGVYLVEGRVSVEYLNRRLGLKLPEGEDYESVAGLILDQTKRIPVEGERIVVAGVELEVSKVSDRAILEVRIHTGKVGRRR